jgi:membrane-associated phospholipid phosphatase
VATAFALAAVLTRLFPGGGPIFYVIAALAAIARLINGAHYVSDVAGGALLGALLGDVVFEWISRALDKWFNPPAGSPPAE